MSAVFSGTIVEAFAEFTQDGDAIFNIQAFIGKLGAVAPAASTSYRNPVSAATVMAHLASVAGYTFENNGVMTQLPPSYFSGSIIAQIQKCAAAANISYIIDGNVLAI
jgi:hypothetical protein